MNKNIVAFISAFSVGISILIGVMSINSTITESAQTEEARLTRLEQSFYVYRDRLVDFEERTTQGNAKLTEYIFKLEQRLANCNR